MISILNTLLEHGSTRPISFIHGARNTSVQAFGDHVRDVAKQHDNITASFFIGAPREQDVEGVHYQHTGRVKLDVLDRTVALFLDNSHTQYFVCGPEGFMSAMEKQLLGFGVGQDRIKMEVFGTGNLVRS
jgi:nitric oxide dioxygenase